MDTLLNLLPGKSPLEAAMGSSGQWSITASDGVKIAYERYGRLDDSRPVIVLIHGWSGERWRFTAAAPVAALLCRRLLSCCCCCPFRFPALLRFECPPAGQRWLYRVQL
jgi:hypothetical protein